MADDKDLNRDLMKVVEEHAPAALARSIRKFVEQAEEDKENIKRQIDVINAYKKTERKLEEGMAKLGIDLSSAKEELKEQKELFGDKKKFDIEVAQFEVTKCNYKVDQLTENNEKLFGLMEIVFRNPVVKTTVIKSGFEPVSMIGNTSSNGYSNSSLGQGSVSTTTDTTVSTGQEDNTLNKK